MNELKSEHRGFRLGDRVRKSGEEFPIEGEIVGIFTKRNGEVKLVIENDHGMLFFYGVGQLEKTQ